MNAVPSGANATEVGSLRPPIATLSVKSVGRIAASPSWSPAWPAVVHRDHSRGRGRRRRETVSSVAVSASSVPTTARSARPYDVSFGPHVHSIVIQVSAQTALAEWSGEQHPARATSPRAGRRRRPSGARVAAAFAGVQRVRRRAGRRRRRGAGRSQRGGEPGRRRAGRDDAASGRHRDDEGAAQGRPRRPHPRAHRPRRGRRPGGGPRRRGRRLPDQAVRVAGAAGAAAGAAAPDHPAGGRGRRGPRASRTCRWTWPRARCAVATAPSS